MPRVDLTCWMLHAPCTAVLLAYRPCDVLVRVLKACIGSAWRWVPRQVPTLEPDLTCIAAALPSKVKELTDLKHSVRRK